ncbi:MAG: hypothetical protein IJN61_05170 [Clostridia bacterium]|nr:hypothetical protein [Clostridia bacterium]
MKTKFSLNALLHNERALLIISVIAAILIWALVSFGPGNIQERTITITETVDLADTIAGYNDLRVIGEDTFNVRVTVEGARSVIFNLNPEDIDIRPAFSEIQGAGVSEISLTATKAKAGSYTITAVSPATISLNCDYWITANVPLTTDATTVSVKDEKTQQIGDLRMESTEITGGMIRVEGPQTVVKRIASVVAKIEEGGVIETTTRFTAALKALDADGNEVETTNCRFAGATADNALDITVPVWVQKSVALSYELRNRPEGISQNGLVKLTPSTITLVGEAAALEAAATTIGNLGTIDFDRLTPADAETEITLNVPTGIKVLEGNTVSVQLGIGNYTSKTLSYAVDGLDDVTVENLPAGKTITLQSQVLSDIVLCGNTATLRRITAKDLKLTLDASGNAATGSVRYAVRITVPKYDNVWVYYGKDDASAYRLYGAVE